MDILTRSKNYAWEFVYTFSEELEEEVFNELRQIKVHTLIIDESTNLMCIKQLIMLVRYVIEVRSQSLVLVPLSKDDKSHERKVE